MRYLIILLFLPLPFLSSAQLTISADYKDTPLSQAIGELQSEYSLVFSYTDDLIQDKVISASFQELELEEGLDLIFEQAGIEIEIINEQYIVLRAKTILPIQLCGTITGENGQKLPFASVLSLRTLTGTQTNDEGAFRWETKINLQDTIAISYVGYLPKKLTAARLLNCPQIQLKLQSFSFSEVLVKDYITSGIEQGESFDHVKLKPSKISVVPGLTEADVLQMVQILPGVQSIDESATGLHIRGGTPDQNLILWDGVPIYNSGHFFGMISAFNPYIVESAESYRGSFGAEYGGRVSSVIDIHSIETIPDKPTVHSGINFTHADFSAVVPFWNQKAAFMVSGRRAYTDIIESPTYKRLSQRIFQKSKIGEAQGVDQEEEDFDYILQFNFTDLNAKWLWQPDEKNKIAVSAFGIHDNLSFSVDNFDTELQTRDDANLDNLGGSAQWERNWRPNFSSKALMSYTTVRNRLEFYFDEQGAGGSDWGSTQLNEIDDLSFKLTNQWEYTEGLQFDFGYQWSDLNVKRQWIFEEEDSGEEEITEHASIHSGFLTMTSKVHDKLLLKTGLRANLVREYERPYFEPRLSLTYFPDQNWQLKASAGQFYQFISQVIELNDLGLNQELWVLSSLDDNIPIAKNSQFAGGFLFNRGTFQLELEGFYKILSGLTSFSPVFINNFQQDNESEGTGTAWGIDLLLKKRWRSYETWLSYSYGRVFYTFDIYNDNSPFPAPHDRPHSLTSVHQLKHKRWDFAVSWKLASGRAYTAADGFFIEEDDAFPEYAYNRANENRLPLYHRLDASVLYNLAFKSNGLEGKIGISALNLYNRRNILSREYFVFFDEEVQSFTLEALDRPMLRFTPNLVLRLSW